jgi:hypothetical protein
VLVAPAALGFVSNSKIIRAELGSRLDFFRGAK